MKYNLIIVMKANKRTNYSKNQNNIMKVTPTSINYKKIQAKKLNEINNIQSQVNISCPNCHFHFKTPLPSQYQYCAPKYDSPQKLNIEGIIQRQFNELSPSSLIKMDLGINKHKKDFQIVYSTNSYIQSQGLQRLKILNEISQMQRSRFKQRQQQSDKKSKKINNSLQTSRFIPTDRNSPDNQQSINNYQDNIHQRQLFQIQNHQPKESIKIFKESSLSQYKPSQMAPQQRWNGHNRQKIQQQVLCSYQKSMLLQHLIDWLRASQLFLSLPTYLRMVLSDEKMSS